MATPYDLEQLEQMIANARHCEEVRAQERKAAIAEMMRPMTAEEERVALELVEQAKESMRLRRLYRKRRREEKKN